MPLVYAGLVPHSPVLVPAIGKEHTERLAKTLQSLSVMYAHLKEIQPDTIIVLAPHARMKEAEHLVIHVPERYVASYEQFGDMVTRQEFAPDTVSADQIKAALVRAKIETAYSSDDELEYSVGVPLYHLTKGLTAKVIVIHPGEADTLKHNSTVGKVLRSSIQNSPKKIALLASGDLSHCLTPEAPGGYNPPALQFDKDLVGILKAQRVRKITRIDPLSIREFGVCGVGVFAMLLQVINTMTHQPHFLSYEYPLGVGHVVMEFTF